MKQLYNNEQIDLQTLKILNAFCEDYIQDEKQKEDFINDLINAMNK